MMSEYEQSLKMSLLAIISLLLLQQQQQPVANGQATGNLRLRGGNHVYEGRLEIFLMGEWGTICDDGWSLQDATVACRQLGFPGVLLARTGAYYGIGDGAILLDEVSCRGDELSLVSCEHATSHDCSHEHDAGVVCIMDDMVQLADGAAANQGRVEIYHDKQWGTVCDDQFGPDDGNIVCRQLGYTQLREYSEGSEATMGSGKIWLDDVNCTGSHVRLSDCRSRGWGITDCIPSDDVTVICEGIPSEPDRPYITDTTCLSTTVSWRPPASNGGRDIQHYWVRYRSLDDTQWSYIMHRPVIPADRLISVSLRNLLPSTTYLVAIAASNTIGNSSFSQPVTMVTKSISFDPPIIVGVANGESGSLNVRWEYTPRLLCGLPASHHLISYTGDYDVTRYQLVQITPPSPLNYSVTDVVVGNQYNISVQVGIVIRYGYVFSVPSDVTSAISLPIDTPLAPPGELFVWSVNASVILLSWQCTDDFIRGHVIQCQQTDGVTWTRHVAITPCVHLEHNVLSNTTYTCMVATYNEEGTGPFSDSVTIATPPADPIPLMSVPVPPIVTLMMVMSDYITVGVVEGSHDIPPGYVAMETIGYEVTCHTASTTRSVVGWGSGVNITVDGLTPYTEYRCDVAGINKYGVSDVTMVTVSTLSTDSSATRIDPSCSCYVMSPSVTSMTSPCIAPTAPPQQLYVATDGDDNYLYWSPPATSQQNGIIIDYVVSCVVVKDRRNPFDASLHDNDDTWSVMLSESGHHNNNPLQVAMPTAYPTHQLVSCRVAGINKDGRGPYEYYVTSIPPAGSSAVTGDDSADDNWYCKDLVAYVLLAVIGVAMVIIVTLVLCLCCRSRYRSKQLFSGQNETNNKTPKNNTYTHYESLDNLYDDKSGTHKSATPSYKPQASDMLPATSSYKPHVHNKLVDDETEEEYMKMAPSRSCSHATIKSDTLRSSDSIRMSALGHHDNTSQYNTLSSNYSHYDTPPSNHHLPLTNSLHSNHNHYDIPPNNKSASTN